jgi:hypothetical protein
MYYSCLFAVLLAEPQDDDVPQVGQQLPGSMTPTLHVPPVGQSSQLSIVLHSPLDTYGTSTIWVRLACGAALAGDGYWEGVGRAIEERELHYRPLHSNLMSTRRDTEQRNSLAGQR